MNRKSVVNGAFYPNSCSEINSYIKEFNNILKDANYVVEPIKPKAIIAPHAGYVYSGFSANAAYRYLENLDIKRVVIIGPSHKVYFEGVSVAEYEYFNSVCGDLKIDTKTSKQLKESFDFIHFYNKAHQEHSTETQVPFILHYKKDVEIIELVYSKVDFKDITKIIQYLDNEDTLFVISTDLSHFYNLKDANKLDNICLNAIKNIDINILDSGCEACGIIGLKAILNFANIYNLNSKIIDYRTSADFSKDENRVVGYVSALIY